ISGSTSSQSSSGTNRCDNASTTDDDLALNTDQDPNETRAKALRNKRGRRSVDLGVQFTEVVVIGAGQAGLSASYHLRRNGIEHVVLDRDDGPGGAWQHRWPGLRLESVHGIHPRHGTPVPLSIPCGPAAQAVSEYVGVYGAVLELPVLRPVKVAAVRPDIDHLAVESAAGVFAARAVINATGTCETPFWPHYPGQ